MELLVDDEITIVNEQTTDGKYGGEKGIEVLYVYNPRFTDTNTTGTVLGFIKKDILEDSLTLIPN